MKKTKLTNEPTTLEIVNFLLGENHTSLYDIPTVDLQMICDAMSKWLQVLESQEILPKSGMPEVE